MTLNISDLVITIAYFSIPIQILVALCKFPRVTKRATKRVVILLVLFAFFILLCGAGHLIRCVGSVDSTIHRIVNALTATVSLTTSVYLLSFIPLLLDGTDKLYLEAAASRSILESLYPPMIRERLLQRGSEDLLPSVMEEGSVNDDYNQNDDVGADTKRPNKSIFHRVITRSDSTTIRRIQDFIQQKRERPSGACADSKPIAESFPDTSIMFADISNFTLWSSMHSPNQVFTLLESLFFEFDKVAMEMEVFKLSTVGDCYIATTGVPYPREDHAIVLAKFSERCRKKANEVLQRLTEQGEIDGISQLKIRIGIHSGPVTAGVLRGNNRFDVFGDTINTASRIESTGEPDRIHISKETAELLEKAGKGDWITPREKSVRAKGKGDLITFWLEIRDDDPASSGGPAGSKGPPRRPPRRRSSRVKDETCDDFHNGHMKLPVNKVELTERTVGSYVESTHEVL